MVQERWTAFLEEGGEQSQVGETPAFFCSPAATSLKQMETASSVGSQKRTSSTRIVVHFVVIIFASGGP